MRIKEGRQTLFFASLDLFNSNASEMEANAEIKKPRKNIIKFIGDVSKMQCTGSACPQHGGLESFLTTCRRHHQPRPPGDISRADLSGLGTWVPCPWPRIVVATVGGGSKSLERNLPNSTNALTLCPSGTTQQNCVRVTRES